MSRVTTLSLHGLYPPSALDPDLADEFAPMVEAHTEKLERILNLLAAEVAKVQESTDLTPTGKTARIQSAGAAAREAIDNAAIPPGLAASLRKADEALPEFLAWPKQPEITPFNRGEAILAELRAIHQKGDPLALQVVLRSAARRGDAETLAVAQKAPALVLDIPDEQLSEAVRLYHEATNPEAVAHRERLRRVEARLRTNVQLASTRVASVVGPDMRASPVAV